MTQVLTHQLAFRLEEDHHAALRRLCEAAGLKPAAMGRTLVLEALRARGAAARPVSEVEGASTRFMASLLAAADAKGYTTASLSRATGYSRAAIIAWRAGTMMPSVTVVDRFAYVLGAKLELRW